MQLAVIGFVGLCGVLKSGSDAGPTWLEILAGILVLIALVLACLATYLVGRAAWPLYDAKRQGAPEDEAGELARTSHRLKSGLRLTFIAVGLLALGSASSWWPSEADAGADSVQVQAQGQSFCGRLAEAPAGVVRIVTAGRPVEVPVQALTAIRSVDGC